MDIVHQAAGCLWPTLKSHHGVLLLGHVAVTTASLVMYKHALYNWEQLPHPPWEGFPIFWREGPEHAAAALSEWLRLMRWSFEWEFTQAMLRCTDRLESEGKLQIYFEYKSCC